MTIDADRKALHEQNRLSWNEATRAHNSHKPGQAAFFRDGGQKLFPEEMGLLGDLTGKRVLHLQCNSGQDTLSLVRLGATATGVDISDEAIDFASGLSRDSGVAAEFIRADVYDYLAGAATNGATFDVVFCSYGAICWLSDLDAWAKGIAQILPPGGRFVTVEFHPMLMIFETDWSVKYDYFGEGKPLTWAEGVSDYVAASGAGLAVSGYEPGIVDFKNPHPVNEFQWPVSDVIGALLRAGLGLETFTEYPYANGWKGFDNMREAEGRRVIQPEGMPSLPMMYSLSARKP